MIGPRNPNGIGDTVKLREVEREIQMRLRVYPGRVASGRMRQDAADQAVAVMRSIANDYRHKLGIVEEVEPKITPSQAKLF